MAAFPVSHSQSSQRRQAHRAKPPGFGKTHTWQHKLSMGGPMALQCRTDRPPPWRIARAHIKQLSRGWHCGTVACDTSCNASIPCGYSSGLSCPMTRSASCYCPGRRVEGGGWSRCLEPLFSSPMYEIQTKLLASTWPSPVCWEHVESELADRKLSNSAFQLTN